MSNSFMESVGPLAQLFSGIGAFFATIMANQYSAYFIVLLVLFLLFYNILKPVLKKIPLFEGDGDVALNKEGGAVAMCVSLLCVFGIGWTMKDRGPQALVDMIAGPYAAFFILGLSLFMGWLGIGLFPDKHWIVRWGLGCIGFSITAGWLVSSSYIAQGSTTNSMIFSGALCFIAFCFFLGGLVSKND